MKAPVSMCMIVKNEPELEQCIMSFRDYVQELVIVDTGSTDNTAAIAKKYADIFEVYTDCNNPETGLIEDFSMARDHALSLSTQPNIIWCDGDDTIIGAENLSRIIQNAPANSYYMFPYEIGFDENGNCSFRYYRERLFQGKDTCHWGGPVHEVLVSKTGAASFTSDEVVYQHRRIHCHKVGEPSRNFRILSKFYEKVGDKLDPRMTYYLARECCDNGKIDEAIKHFTRYMSISEWDDEQAMACLKMVDIYQGQAKYEEAISWAFRTIGTKEKWCEGYFALGKCYYFMAMNNINSWRNWQRAVHFIQLGLSQPPTETVLFLNPMERECDIHKYLNLALSKVGDIKGALESVLIGMKKKPNDPMFLQNKQIYEGLLK